MDLTKNDQADRAISTSKLHASRRFHTWPINVVVYHGSRRSLVSRWVSRLDAFSGYLVRTVATRRCSWRYNRYTRGTSIPVLSY